MRLSTTLANLCQSSIKVHEGVRGTQSVLHAFIRIAARFLGLTFVLQLSLICVGQVKSMQWLPSVTGSFESLLVPDTSYNTLQHASHGGMCEGTTPIKKAGKQRYHVFTAERKKVKSNSKNLKSKHTSRHLNNIITEHAKKKHCKQHL